MKRSTGLAQRHGGLLYCFLLLVMVWLLAFAPALADANGSASTCADVTCPPNFTCYDFPDGPQCMYTYLCDDISCAEGYWCVWPFGCVGSPAPPYSVTVAGSLQSEVGCPGDWQTTCALTNLVYDAVDDVWQGSWPLPAGSYEYKAAINGSWLENYGQGGVENGPNIPIDLPASASVKFYYDHKSHWAADDHSAVIVTAPGSFQSELGCPGDWQPDCLRSWLQDPDGDGLFTFSTMGIPPGSYETKVAINENLSENYGASGVPNGANIPFSVLETSSKVTFSYVANTHILTITEEALVPAMHQTWGRVKAAYR